MLSTVQIISSIDRKFPWHPELLNIFQTLIHFYLFKFLTSEFVPSRANDRGTVKAQLSIPLVCP